MKPNANFRRDIIPFWINALSILVILILALKSISAYFYPGLAYANFDASTLANQKAMMELAGRNVVMLLLTIAALRSQNAMFLTYSFLMHLIRELQDMLIVPYYVGFTSVQGIGIFFVFLFVFVIPYLFALKKLRTLAALPD